MELETNRLLARRWFEEVWNKQSKSAIDELLSADAITYGLGGSGTATPPPGREPFVTFWRQFCGAFPDIQISVDDVIAERDLTCTRISFQGTHKGDHLGAAPTNACISATGLCLTRWRNGQIVEAWNEFDALGVMMQAKAIRLA